MHFIRKSIEAKYRSEIIENMVSAHNLDYLLRIKIRALSGGEILTGIIIKIFDFRSSSFIL